MLRKFFIPALVSPILVAQPSPTAAAAKQFTESFYSWYCAIAAKDTSQPPAEIALKKKRNCFSAALAQALEDDFEAQNNTPGEIVGIDYDPFLDSQDPARSYKASEVAQKGDAFEVSVHVTRKGKLASRPSVLAVVKSINGKLVFTDFKSPNGRSLLAVLHSLKVGRNSPRK